MAYKIKTNFIKKKIKGKSFDNRSEYILDLIHLEKLITEGPHDLGSAYKFYGWKTGKYKKEYHTILTELYPNWRKEEKEEKEKQEEEEKKEEAKERIEEEKEEKEARKEWIKAGGK